MTDYTSMLKEPPYRPPLVHPTRGGGCIPSAPLRFDAPVPTCRAPVPRFDVADAMIDLSPYCNPAQLQTGGSCGANGFANAVEVMLRRGCPSWRVQEIVEKKLPKREDGVYAPWQVMGDEIYADACLAFHGNLKDAGLEMSEIAQLGDLTGIFAGESVVRIEVNTEALADALAHGPFLMGRALCAGDNEPDPTNGYVAVSMPNPVAGHCQCVVEYRFQAQELYWLVQQTWGRKFGWNGYVRYGDGFLQYCQFPGVNDRPMQWRPVGDWWERNLDALVKWIGTDVDPGGMQ